MGYKNRVTQNYQTQLITSNYLQLYKTSLKARIKIIFRECYHMQAYTFNKYCMINKSLIIYQIK